MIQIKFEVTLKMFAHERLCYNAISYIDIACTKGFEIVTLSTFDSGFADNISSCDVILNVHYINFPR